MNGEQMYKFLADIGEEGRKGILDVTWWDIPTIKGIINDMCEDADVWLSSMSEKEREALINTSDEELADILEEALNGVDGDGEHCERVRQSIREILVRRAKDKCSAAGRGEEKEEERGRGIRLDNLVFDYGKCKQFITDNFGEKSDITPERIFDRLSGYMIQFDEWPEDDWYGIEFDSGEMLDVNIFGSEYSDFNENITLYPVKKVEGSEYPEGDYDNGYNVYQQ